MVSGYNERILNSINVPSGGKVLEKSSNRISINNYVLQNGTLGEYRATNEVVLNGESEIQLGAEFIIETATIQAAKVCSYSGRREEDPMVMETVNSSSDLSESKVGMYAFPNPASNRITFSYILNSNSDVKITLFDLTGQVVGEPIFVAQEGLGQYEKSIDISSLSDGLYTYTLTTNAGSTTGKVVVTR